MAITKEHRQKITESRKRTIENRIVCKNGHPWIEENIYIKKGVKNCLICRRENDIKKGATKEGKESRKNSLLKHRFGITLQGYNDLLKQQNYKCAICGRHQSEFFRKFAVDHCHITDKVRGLLCGNCNMGIGSLQDNITILENAIKYLKNA